MKRLVLFLVVFWNVENFFDWRDGGYSASDAEFSSAGARHWTRRRFDKKCSDIARTVFCVADIEGSLPDVVALAEVENDFVLRRLVEQTGLWKYGYRPLHFESRDHRGIDVGLLYREEVLELVSARPQGVDSLPTRDILVACFRRRTAAVAACSSGGLPLGYSYLSDNVVPADRTPDSLAVLVCHHPSKYGGSASDGPRARAVAATLAAADSLDRVGWHKRLIIGDFNDTPDSPSYDGMRRSYRCLVDSLAARGRGTIRFEGAWELIDQAWVPLVEKRDTSGFVGASGREGTSGVTRVWIADFPHLTQRDPSHPGRKPLRTYSGPRYLGGVSDHYPIVVQIR